MEAYFLTNFNIKMGEKGGFFGFFRGKKNKFCRVRVVGLLFYRDWGLVDLFDISLAF